MLDTQLPLRENMRVSLELQRGAGTVTFPSRIEWIVREQVGLAAPMNGNTIVPLARGETVSLLVVVGARAHRAVTDVIGLTTSPLPCVEVRRPQAWQRVERRSRFRVGVMLKVHGDANRDGTAVPIMATTRDLSGGGLRVHVPLSAPGYSTTRRLLVGQALMLRIELPDGEINCVGGVLRKEDRPTGLDLSLQFEAIAECDRERLIRFGFAVERDAMNKGLVQR